MRAAYENARARHSAITQRGEDEGTRGTSNSNAGAPNGGGDVAAPTTRCVLPVVCGMSGTRFTTVMLQFVPASFVVGAGMELFMLNTVRALS